MPDAQVVTLHSRAGEAQGLVTDPEDHIQARWVRGEFFETRMLEYIYWHFKGRVFVDVGSNIGNHTLFFAKFCSPRMVISVEPYAKVREHQERVLALNGVHKRVQLHGLALSDAPGRGTMRPWSDRQVYHDNTMTLVEGDEVEVTTLDALMSDVKHVNLVKIDVEGHEPAVLRGGLEFLKRERPHLFIEVRSRAVCEEVWEILKPLGYHQLGALFQDATAVEYAP